MKWKRELYIYLTEQTLESLSRYIMEEENKPGDFVRYLMHRDVKSLMYRDLYREIRRRYVYDDKTILDIISTIFRKKGVYSKDLDMDIEMQLIEIRGLFTYYHNSTNHALYEKVLEYGKLGQLAIERFNLVDNDETFTFSFGFNLLEEDVRRMIVRHFFMEDDTMDILKKKLADKKLKKKQEVTTDD